MIGYKCFNSNLTNRYNTKFEIGKIYHRDGTIKFGNKGNGFHMCLNLEDTLRYFDSFNEDIKICLVNGFGRYEYYEDNYNGFYDMYSFEYIQLLKILTRKEIINYGLKLNEIRVERFISLYKLNNDEIELFINKFKNYDRVIKCIKYYQLNDKNIYKRVVKKV